MRKRVGEWLHTTTATIFIYSYTCQRASVCYLCLQVYFVSFSFRLLLNFKYLRAKSRVLCVLPTLIYNSSNMFYSNNFQFITLYIPHTYSIEATIVDSCNLCKIDKHSHSDRLRSWRQRKKNSRNKQNNKNKIIINIQQMCWINWKKLVYQMKKLFFYGVHCWHTNWTESKFMFGELINGIVCYAPWLVVCR